jgi:hypothetical protein
MASLDLHNRRFIGVVNYDDGDANQDTVFRYYQDGDLVWGTYEGGRIRHGQILGRVNPEGKLDMAWQYLNLDDQIVAGTCTSTPELLPDGRYRLNEKWETTLGPAAGQSGESAIEEMEKES